MDKAKSRFWASLYACGREGMPKEVSDGTRQYRLHHVFKHDFFAATGQYLPLDSGDAAPIILKINRKQPFFGIPMGWMGRFLRNREIRILTRLESIDQVPRLIGPWDKCGLIYKYIEGQSLDEKPRIPDSFFEDLEHLLDRIHRQNVCYLDLNKRGNILIGQDGRPYLIDFQISLLASQRGRLCRLLQREDRYHLLKHKRRLRPDLMSQTERAESYRKSTCIRFHRAIAGPYRAVRRRLMRWLYRHHCLHSDSAFDPSPENNPRRHAE